MDLTKVNTALATAQAELNKVVDSEFTARRLSGLRPLSLAQNAITLTETHLAKAAARVAPKAPKAEAPAATNGKKK